MRPWYLLLLATAAVGSAAPSLRGQTGMWFGIVRAEPEPERGAMRLGGGVGCGLVGGGLLACFGGLRRARGAESVPAVVGHEFVAFFETEHKHDTHMPAVVGSWQEWNVAEAVPLHRDAGIVRWTATVDLAQEVLAAGIEFKYVLLPVDGGSDSVLWEDGPNRELRLEGVNATGAGQHIRHELNAAPSYAEVSFRARVGEAYSLKEGEFVAVVGSSTALGRWNPEMAMRLTESTVDAGMWEAKLSMPLGKEVEFKFVVLDSSEFASVMWEDGPNHRCSTSLDGDVEMDTSTHILGAMTAETPDAKSLPRSSSTPGGRLRMAGRKLAGGISRLESFQRILKPFRARAEA